MRYEILDEEYIELLEWYKKQTELAINMSNLLPEGIEFKFEDGC